MTTKELQLALVARINEIAELRAANALALPENDLAIMDKVTNQLKRGVAVVVVTPDMERDGSNTTAGMPASSEVLVRCEEVRTLNRTNPDAITALDAADLVRSKLDSATLRWQRTSQRLDRNTGRILVTATFSTSVFLT